MKVTPFLFAVAVHAAAAFAYPFGAPPDATHAWAVHDENRPPVKKITLRYKKTVCIFVKLLSLSLLKNTIRQISAIGSVSISMFLNIIIKMTLDFFFPVGVLLGARRNLLSANRQKRLIIIL